MNGMRRVIVIVLATMLLSGCYEVHHGRYVAAKAFGWSRWQYAGGNFFYYHTKHTPNWFIQIGGTEIGKPYLRIGSNAYDPATIWKFLTFSGDPIRIIFHY
jgi:hypothetical protein